MATKKHSSTTKRKPAARKPTGPVKFKALLNKAQIRKGIKKTDEAAPVWRIALFLLSKDSERLYKELSNDPKSTMEFWESLDALLKRRESETEMLNVAKTRVFATLARIADAQEAEAAEEGTNSPSQ
jgi:hypothetical protein